MSGPPTNCCPAASRQHVWLNCGKASTCSRVGMSSITGVEGHYPGTRPAREPRRHSGAGEGGPIPFPRGHTEKMHTPPDLVVKFQPVDIVEVILWLVLRPRVGY